MRRSPWWVIGLLPMVALSSFRCGGDETAAEGGQASGGSGAQGGLAGAPAGGGGAAGGAGGSGGAEGGATPFDYDDPAPFEQAPLAPGWTCSAFESQGDIWIRTFEAGAERFDMRIGAGGVISELRHAAQSYAPLLSPSFSGEATDRVIQWTWWSPSITHTVPALPQFEWRFNVTQAGTFESLLAPTHFVTLDAGDCMVEVWSSPRDQWKTEQQPYMQGVLAARTRYRVFGAGLVAVRRTILVGDATLEGQPATYDEVYLEAWTPMRRPTFDALALSLDGAGTPTWWYAAGQNLPQYPFIDVTTTNGYAAVFAQASPATSAAVGVVFGKQHPCLWSAGQCLAAGSLDLNSMEWNNGIGVLPGLSLSSLESGQVVDYDLVIAPSQGLSGTFTASLADTVTVIPAPRILQPGASLPPALSQVVQLLGTLADDSGTRSDHLAPLLQ